jgi:hypothetical protein
VSYMLVSTKPSHAYICYLDYTVQNEIPKGSEQLVLSECCMHPLTLGTVLQTCAANPPV